MQLTIRTLSSAASAAASSFSKKAAEEAEAEINETYLHRSALARATDYWHSHKTLQVYAFFACSACVRGHSCLLTYLSFILLVQ